MEEITFRIQQWKSLPEFEITFHEEKKIKWSTERKAGLRNEETGRNACAGQKECIVQKEKFSFFCTRHSSFCTFLHFFHCYEVNIILQEGNGVQNVKDTWLVKVKLHSSGIRLTIQPCLLDKERLGIGWEGNENQRTVHYNWRKLFWVSSILYPFINGQSRTDSAFA